MPSDHGPQHKYFLHNDGKLVQDEQKHNTMSHLPVLQIAQVKGSAAGADVAVLVRVDFVVGRDEAV